MIKLDFDEPSSASWIDWRQECAVATQQLIAAVQRGESPQLTDLYKNQKAVYTSLSGPFYGKCAYCESFIAADQPGDLDHFRPKGKVTDSDHQPIMIQDKQGHEIPHPGYYWLAYDWKNLLPSCADCNRPARQKTGGQRIGKWDQFPVKGFRATTPGEETQEEPLLIHPVFQDPEQHLSVDDTGIFAAKTPEGKTCIDIFGLNVREALVECRRTAYRETKNKVITLLNALHHNASDVGDHLNELLDIKRGKRPYSAPARVAIQKEYEILKLAFDLFGQTT